jgi:hypothetical protein
MFTVQLELTVSRSTLVYYGKRYLILHQNLIGCLQLQNDSLILLLVLVLAARASRNIKFSNLCLFIF